MRTEDGTRAWQIRRRLPAHRQAWCRGRPRAGLSEPAPSPIRLQTGIDRAAAGFGPLVWGDPFEEPGPVPPVRAVVPVVTGLRGVQDQA